MEDRGEKITVNLANDGPVDGWLYADTPLGRYVALDPAGTNIRFIPRADLSSMLFHRQAPKAEFASRYQCPSREQIKSLTVKLEQPISAALAKINYNRMRQLLEQFHRAGRAVQHIKHDYPEPLHVDLALAKLLLLRRDYADLLDEVAQARLLEIFVENASDIRMVLCRDTLPELDALIASPGEIDALISEVREIDHLCESKGGREYLLRLSEEQIISFMRRPPHTETEEPQGNKVSIDLRIIAATGKMAVGGSLAAANIGLGAFAGIISALPTLGLGSVPAVVGIATSAFAGLNAACDALKDLATALE